MAMARKKVTVEGSVGSLLAPLSGGLRPREHFPGS
jgi:hypothetical protein